MAGENAEAEARARTMGWLPKEQFKGAPERWQDADAYLKRGEEIMPILQANNRQLTTDVAAMRAENGRLATMLQGATESIEELKNFNSQMAVERAKTQKERLLGALKAAREADDVEKESQIQTQLNELSISIADAGKSKTKPAEAAKPAEQQHFSKSPEFKVWAAENAAWFGVDRRRTAVAMAIAEEIRLDAGNAALVGRPFLDRISQELERTFAPPTAASKTEGGSRPEGGGSKPKHTYNELPPDAKAACERGAKRVVGAKGSGRAYETIEAYRDFYVANYAWDE